MDRYEDEMIDELGLDEAEGASDHWDETDELDEGDELDEVDEGDEIDELDETDELDEGDEIDELDETDEFDEYDETDEEGDEIDDEAWDEVMAHALGAEDTDEFFRRIARGLRRVAQGAGRVAGRVGGAIRRAAPVVGQIARVVGPIASAIPLPQAQAIGRVANVVGRLMADEASEEEALEAFAELAVRNRGALPVAAGLAARRVLGPAAARMPMAQRVQAVRTVRRAATGMVNRGGPAAARALPRIARSVRRTGVARRTPAAVRPRVLARTARRVGQRNPRLRRQLQRPLPAGRRVLARTAASVRAGQNPGAAAMRRAGVRGPMGGAALGGLGRIGGALGGGRGRRINIRGPVTISIRPR